MSNRGAATGAARRRGGPRGRIRSFAFVAAGARTEVVIGSGALALAASLLPSIAPGRWFLITSKKIFRLHGQRLLRARRAGRGVLDPVPLFVPDGEAAKTWDVLGASSTSSSAAAFAATGASWRWEAEPWATWRASRRLSRSAAFLSFRRPPRSSRPPTARSVERPRWTSVRQEPRGNVPRAPARRSGARGPRDSEGPRRPLGPRRGREVLLPRRGLRPGDGSPRSAPRRARAGRPRGSDRAVAPAEGADRVARSVRDGQGRRVFLNLGHTAGHALEAASGHALAHGESVAWGLLAALELSARRAGLSRPTADRLARRVAGLVKPRPPEASTLAGFRKYLKADKKSDRSGLRMVLLERPGRPVVARVSGAELAAVLRMVLRRYNR